MRPFMVMLTDHEPERWDQRLAYTVQADCHEDAAMIALRLEWPHLRARMPHTFHARVAHTTHDNIRENGFPICVHGFSLKCTPTNFD